MWGSREEVLEPLTKKEFNLLMTTPHLVESLGKVGYRFFELGIFSGLAFGNGAREWPSRKNMCHDFGRMHYNLIFCSTKLPKTMEKIKEKHQMCTWRNSGTGQPLKSKCFPLVVRDSGGKFSDKPKRCWHVEQQLSALNPSNPRSHIDCIWEKTQPAGSDDNTIRNAGVLSQLEQLEKSSSHFRRTIPDIVIFLAQN